MPAASRTATSLRFTLKPPAPFELKLALFGHGWIDLAPNEWDESTQTWRTVIGRADGADDVADLEARATPRGLLIRLAGRAPRRADATAALDRMLRLHHDFTPFWKQCAATPGLEWVARRGAGRLLAGATLFEDLVKLVFTTNCSWAATRLMTSRLIAALGTPALSGRRAFPPPAACAREPERFWRDVVRAGYRARALHALADRFASGELAADQFEDRALPTEEVRRRLLALDGFGPYAAGQALRLLGRHDDLALDSWCRAKLAQRLGKKRAPSDRTIERRFARFGAERGLVLWMELTADWHGERAGAERDTILALFRRG